MQVTSLPLKQLTNSSDSWYETLPGRVLVQSVRGSVNRNRCGSTVTVTIIIEWDARSQVRRGGGRVRRDLILDRALVFVSGGDRRQGVARGGLHPKPYTLSPYTLSPHTLHPHTLQPTPGTLQPYTLPPAPCTLHPTP